MSLNFNLTKCKQHEELIEQWATTESVIFLCMATDIGWKLTEKNIKEFSDRVRLLEKLFGAWRGKHVDGVHEDVYFTEGELRKYIGLEVNVSPVPSAKWLKRQWSRFTKEVK